MDRIIFDNVQRGFPANEKFMQIVDKNRLALLEVCGSIFGDRPTILKGVEPTIISENQGKKQISISSGVVWTGSDLVYIKESQVETVNPDRTLTVIIGDSREKGKFHDGNEYDAYLRNEGRVIAADYLPDKMLLRNYTRSNITQSVSTKIDIKQIAGDYSVRGVLRQNAFLDGRVNICGMVAVLAAKQIPDLNTLGVKVARLSHPNKDIKSYSVGARIGNVYPVAVTFETGMLSPDERIYSFSHFAKITNEGDLYIFVPYEKFGVPNQGIYLNAYISIDITYNSKGI